MRRLRIAIGVAATVLGTAAILCGVGAAGFVAGVDGLVGTHGVVSQEMGTISGGPTDVAVIVDGVKADITAGELPDAAVTALALMGTSPAQVIQEHGSFVLLATPPDAGDAFLALGSPASVDDYLFGHPYAVAELDSGREWREISVPGEGTPGPPGDRAWIEVAQGRPAELPAAGLSGQTLVIMRPDAIPPVSAAMRLEYRVPEAPLALQTAALTTAGASVGGLLLVLLGAWLIVGRKARGRHA